MFSVSVRLPFECLSNTVPPLPILPIIIYRWGWWGALFVVSVVVFALFVVSFVVFSFPVGLFGSVLAPRSSPLLFPGGSRFVLVELVVFPVAILAQTDTALGVAPARRSCRSL